jgi:hypothetical protein
MNIIKISKRPKEIKLKRTVKVKCIYTSDNLKHSLKNHIKKTKSNNSNNNTKQTSQISSKASKNIHKKESDGLCEKKNNSENKTKIINVLWSKNIKNTNNNKKLFKKYNKINLTEYKTQNNSTISENFDSNFLNYHLGNNKKEYEDDVLSNSQFISIINQLNIDENNNNNNNIQNQNSNQNINYNFNNDDNNEKEMEINLSDCDIIDESFLLPKNKIEREKEKEKENKKSNKKTKRIKIKSNSLLDNSNSNYVLNTEEFNENERILPKYIINNYHNINFYNILKSSDF